MRKVEYTFSSHKDIMKKLRPGTTHHIYVKEGQHWPCMVLGQTRGNRIKVKKLFPVLPYRGSWK